MAAASRPSPGAWGWHGEAALRLPIEIAATRCSWASEEVDEWENSLLLEAIAEDTLSMYCCDAPSTTLFKYFLCDQAAWITEL